MGLCRVTMKTLNGGPCRRIESHTRMFGHHRPAHTRFIVRRAVANALFTTGYCYATTLPVGCRYAMAKHVIVTLSRHRWLIERLR